MFERRMQGESLTTAIAHSSGGKAGTAFGDVEYIVHEYLVKEPGQQEEEHYRLYLVNGGKTDGRTAKHRSFFSLQRHLEDGGVSVEQQIWRSL